MLFAEITDAYKNINYYNGTNAILHDLLLTDERDYPKDAVCEYLIRIAIVNLRRVD